MFFPVKNVIFFVIFAKKNLKGWSDNVETFQKENSVVFENNLENTNFIAAALHCENWYFKKQIFATIFQARISNKIKYFISETIHAQENGSRGTHFAKFLISNFHKSLTYSAVIEVFFVVDKTNKS